MIKYKPWGAGCVMFELTTMYPLFSGTSQTNQIDRIHRVLGTPSEILLRKMKKHASLTFTSFSFLKQNGIGLTKLLPGAEDSYLDLLKQSLAYDANERITSKLALRHPYLTGVGRKEPVLPCEGRLDQYRIAFLPDQDQDDDELAALAQNHGASIIFVDNEGVPTSKQDEFNTWWDKQVEDSKRDHVALVILAPLVQSQNALKWLQQKEEDEWDGSDFGKTRFVTNKALQEAIESNDEEVLLLDSWGDAVNVPNIPDVMDVDIVG